MSSRSSSCAARATPPLLLPKSAVRAHWEEVKKLVETVLQEAAVTDAVMNSCFEEMDADNSGTVEW